MIIMIVVIVVKGWGYHMNLKHYVLTALAVSALTMPWAPGISQAAAVDASAQAAAAKTAA